MIGYRPKRIVYEQSPVVTESRTFRKLAVWAQLSRIPLAPMLEELELDNFVQSITTSVKVHRSRMKQARDYFVVRAKPDRFLDERLSNNIVSKDVYRLRGCRIFSLRMSRGFCPGECAYCYLQRRFWELPFPTVYVDHLALKKELAKLEHEGIPSLIDAGEEQDMFLTPLMRREAFFLISELSKYRHLKLELRTKSAPSLPIAAPSWTNTVIAWTITTPTVWRKCESRNVASPAERIKSLIRAASLGYCIGVKFNPLVAHARWQEEMAELITTIVKSVPPEAIDHWSMGVLHLSPRLMEIMLHLRPEAAALLNTDNMVEEGTYSTYPVNLRLEMYLWMRQFIEGLGNWRSIPFYVSLEQRCGEPLRKLAEFAPNMALAKER